MRCLGIETSSRKGSVALVEAGRVVGRRSHQELNRHGERMLPLIEELLAEADWSLNSLDRLGVGVGPGSFTGLRIGVSLAQGIALGLDCPVVGVGSLHAMARAAAPRPNRIAAVLDARRNEYFAAIFDGSARELVGPRAIAQAGALETLAELAGGPFCVVGQAAADWEGALAVEWADLPDAGATALLACELDPTDSPAVPLYIRGANAIKPNLPPSPLHSAESPIRPDESPEHG